MTFTPQSGTARFGVEAPSSWQTGIVCAMTLWRGDIPRRSPGTIGVSRPLVHIEAVAGTKLVQLSQEAAERAGRSASAHWLTLTEGLPVA